MTYRRYTQIKHIEPRPNPSLVSSVMQAEWSLKHIEGYRSLLNIVQWIERYR